MAKAKKPLSPRTELRLGREFQERYDHGDNWSRIAVDYDMSQATVKRLAKIYRDDCDRRAHQHQLTLFN
ncbi:hypothetical protein LTV02_17920 [Nocardia yamanashiensis]|uniref:hypothetical protein n=1 Tax=Nocardia yamanashiensis TaxID=209247 RepID=UPI001E3626D8|nr:hypothetical protein [Nocardia yamanashiensis]UGT45149.1 hypothetical protein LTV02_17920 [Nocardia yamanashiensis]